MEKVSLRWRRRFLSLFALPPAFFSPFLLATPFGGAISSIRIQWSRVPVRLVEYTGPYCPYVDRNGTCATLANVNGTVAFDQAYTFPRQFPAVVNSPHSLSSAGYLLRTAPLLAWENGWTNWREGFLESVSLASVCCMVECFDATGLLETGGKQEKNFLRTRKC